MQLNLKPVSVFFSWYDLSGKFPAISFAFSGQNFYIDTVFLGQNFCNFDYHKKETQDFEIYVVPKEKSKAKWIHQGQRLHSQLAPLYFFSLRTGCDLFSRAFSKINIVR